MPRASVRARSDGLPPGASHLERELFDHLGRTAPAGPHGARNLRIVRYFYGFEDARWPTLEETARAFSLGSRERVRQILNEVFRRHVDPTGLPRLRAAADVLRSRPFWLVPEFAAAIGQGAAGSLAPGCWGVLRLIRELDLAGGHELYDHRLERLGRPPSQTNVAHVVVAAELAPALKAALDEARRRGRRLGVAGGEQLAPIARDGVEPAMLQTLLEIDPDCWTARGADRFWYAPEGPDNALVGLAAKVFTVADRVRLPVLAESLCNGLRAHSRRRPCPPRAQVEAWLRESGSFRRAGEWLSFEGAPGCLTPLEQELVAYLAARPKSDYRALKAHLQLRGVSQSMIAKAATLSPLVQIDRSAGPRAYAYSLIGRG